MAASGPDSLPSAKLPLLGAGNQTRLRAESPLRTKECGKRTGLSRVSFNVCMFVVLDMRVNRVGAPLSGMRRAGSVKFACKKLVIHFDGSLVEVKLG